VLFGRSTIAFAVLALFGTLQFVWIAQRASAQRDDVRLTDTVARLGGDEFVVPQLMSTGRDGGCCTRH